MPNRTPRHYFLLSFTLLITALVIGLCLHAATRVENTANDTVRKLAQQDVIRIRQNLNDWSELRRQSLRGLAALFAGSSSVEKNEFDLAAVVLRKQGDSLVELPLAYARLAADHHSLKIIYSTETTGPLAQGRELIGDPEAATLIKTAFPTGNHTISSPVFLDAHGQPCAFMAYPLQEAGDGQQLMLTLIKYRDLFNSITLPEQGIVLRAQITPPGGKPTYVNGSATPTPGVMFTIRQSGNRNGSHFQHDWDFMPNYAGRQSSAEELAQLIRYGGTMLTLVVALLIWQMLRLYRQSLQREDVLLETRDQAQKSELHYRTLIDQVPGAVFRAVAMPERRKVYFSPAIEALTGYSAEALLSTHRFRDLIAPEDAKRVQVVLDEHRNTTGSYELEYRIIARDGSERWVFERSQNFLTSDGIRMIDGVLIDVTERKKSEASLQGTVNLLRGIFDNAPDVIIQGISLGGAYRFWNRASEQILGWDENQAIGKTFLDLGLLDEASTKHALALFAEMATNMQPLSPGEWGVTRHNGEQCVILATLFPIQDEHGDIMIVAIALDITERKKTEDALIKTRDHLEDLVTARTDDLHQRNQELKHAMGQLVQSEKLASLGSLVAGIAHELNTPLGNSVTVASTLRQKVQEFRRVLNENQLRRSELEQFTQSCEEAALLIEKSSQRAGELISNFKQVAVDTTSSRRREFDLRQTVEEVVSTLQPLLKHTSHRVDIDIPHGLRLESYPGPIEQIVTNLVTNAHHHAFATQSLGVITLRAHAINEAQIELVISDNGCGIPEPLKKRVFDPFFTTKLGQGGSGLGLYIVFNLVHGVLGGKLALSDAAGAGARFIITLPRIAPLTQEPLSDEQSATS